MENREEISRYLTEKVLGKCWHDWIYVGWIDEETLKCKFRCGKCGGCYFTKGEEPIKSNPFTPQGIFALIKAGRGKDWWADFEQDELCGDFTDATRVFERWGIDWDNFFNLPEVMYNFLQEREL